MNITRKHFQTFKYMLGTVLRETYKNFKRTLHVLQANFKRKVLGKKH